MEGSSTGKIIFCLLFFIFCPVLAILFMLAINSNGEAERIQYK